MNIPKTMSGRAVTPRGVHLLPGAFHDHWLRKRDYWVGLLTDMHMSWCLALSASDNILISGAAEALLDAGIIPIIRFSYLLPNRFTEMAATERLVALYGRYNAPCIIQFANEPFDDREWAKDKNGNSKRPKNSNETWVIIRDRWREAARLITERGAIAGFPDGPCYDRNPFAIIGDDDHLWADGKAVYLGHYYGLGRPLDYPRDDVSRNGTPLTMDEYRAALDDFADDPGWNEGQAVLAAMNAQRAAWANPNNTPLTDDSCWRGWEKTLWYSRQAFGFEVQVAMTEGGWTPRARAGTNSQTKKLDIKASEIDIRWPLTTPKMVAEKTMEMYQADSPLFALCPWLLADEDMGQGGWPFDAWVGWAYTDKYGREKPVVQILKENPPGYPLKEGFRRVLPIVEDLRKMIERKS